MVGIFVGRIIAAYGFQQVFLDVILQLFDVLSIKCFLNFDGYRLRSKTLQSVYDFFFIYTGTTSRVDCIFFLIVGLVCSL